MAAALILLVLGFGPSLVWLYWLWSRDKFQREPLGLIAGLMLSGSLISVSLTLLTVPLYAGSIPSAQDSVIVNMLLTAALPEETFKMLPVLLIAWRSPQWNEPFDGIVYAGASALGFHLSETLLYMVRALDENLGSSLYQALIRGAKPGHMLYGVAMGYFLSRARFAPRALQRWRYLALSLLVPVGLHTAWNASAAYGGNVVGGESFEELLLSLIAWGLSVALWVTAFEYMRRDQAASPWNPEARSVAAAPVPCPACSGSYPAGAAYCPSCGAAVQVVSEV